MANVSRTSDTGTSLCLLGTRYWSTVAAIPCSLNQRATRRPSFSIDKKWYDPPGQIITIPPVGLFEGRNTCILAS